MTTKPNENIEHREDRNGLFEKELIEEYLLERGYTLESLKKLPVDIAKQLMKEASQYATLKMEEVKAQAHFVKGLQSGGSSLK